MTSSKAYKRKADKLLKLGDSLSSTNRAESKRLLRRCYRYRMKTKQRRKEENR